MASIAALENGVGRPPRLLSLRISLATPNVLLRLSLVVLIMPVLLLAGRYLAAQTAPTKEYQVKAVFLLNFAQFVEWPRRAFAHEGTSFVIGVLGDDPFGHYLDEVVRDERVKNRPVEVQRYGRVEEIKTCHVLFISRTEVDRVDQIAATLKGRSILTVGDTEGFARGGGIIRFITENGKLRLRINMEAAKASDLTISSKLLRSAEIVTTERH